MSWSVFVPTTAGCGWSWNRPLTANGRIGNSLRPMPIFLAYPVWWMSSRTHVRTSRIIYFLGELLSLLLSLSQLGQTVFSPTLLFLETASQRASDGFRESCSPPFGGLSEQQEPGDKGSSRAIGGAALRRWRARTWLTGWVGQPQQQLGPRYTSSPSLLL